MMENAKYYISKDELQEKDYSWDEDAETTLTPPLRQPTRLPFDRYNGPQMLFMVNYFLQETDNTKEGLAAEIERLLRDRLPFGITSEVAVFNWLISLYHETN